MVSSVGYLKMYIKGGFGLLGFGANDAAENLSGANPLLLSVGTFSEGNIYSVL